MKNEILSHCKCLTKFISRFALDLFLSDPSPIIGYACQWLTHSLTHSLLFSKFDWCEPGMWRWQLKTCWSCWWWETVYSVTFSIQFLTVLKSFSRLVSNSLTFLQLVKAVKTLTGGATIVILNFKFSREILMFADVEILKLVLGQYSEEEIWSNFVFDLVIWLK